MPELRGAVDGGAFGVEAIFVKLSAWLLVPMLLEFRWVGDGWTRYGLGEKRKEEDGPTVKWLEFGSTELVDGTCCQLL